MKSFLLSSLSFLFFFTFICIPIQRVLCENKSGRGSEHASLPPRGWNSYDSFCWVVSEKEFLQNAELVSQRLQPLGYEFVVVDYLWYRKNEPGAYVDSLGHDVIDEWGRMVPDPARWPSSIGGRGFSEVAQKVHSMGLKFGIHVMRGISTQAVNANTPILDITTGRAYVESGRKWYAKDIGQKERACAWMTNGFMSVNTKLGAGRAFLRSLYQQYADWGIDFVKHDCVFGDDLDLDEINAVSELLRGFNRPILYSLSPGTSATPTMAKAVSHLVNMYRITGDDWDKWEDVAAHFNVARDFSTSNMIGAEGLLGKSWPDLDMLPLGWLTDAGSNRGPYRKSNLNLDEQRTQMTLWSMAKSPLMFGGDMRNLDETTFNLITNPTLLEINFFSSNNLEFPYITGSEQSQSRNRGLTWQSRKLTDDDAKEASFLGLTSCTDSEARGWSTKFLDDDLGQVCWRGGSRTKQHVPFCLYTREPLYASGEEMMYKRHYEGKLHLLASNAVDFCLDASPRKKLTSKEFKRGSFSPCRWDSNQMWELTDNGTLINSYSGLCARMRTVEVNAGTGGIRGWIATGRKGEIYVAFFNLNSETTVISLKLSDLAKALPGKNLNDGSCTGQEVWSGRDFGLIKQSLSISIARHGCALFVLNCT